ncbi:MAG: phenylalanine--tRNA ligase subunit beta, partial [Balneolaceae bacterium]
MKISYNWLKEYLDIPLPPEETAEKLSFAGLEVEELESFGSSYDGFVVGEVLEVKIHPNADQLYLCQVKLDDKKEVQIVCGADNVAAGQKVPVATVGANLPVPLEDGSTMTIRKAKLRGEPSEGMICAEDELGLSDDHSGIMVLENSLKAGTPLKEALNLEKDTLFEIGLTPNRPDAASHIGTARDLAAVLEKTIDHPYTTDPGKADPLDDRITIDIRDPEKCHRYTAMMVENITVGESPAWLKNRLRAIGLRPINNVVDATNYVLHEVGQPLHAFDYQKLAGQKIIVQSYSGEKSFTTLDGVERKIPADTLFICDAEKPIAIAGVMGGADTEVTDKTDTILLESACFHPSSIRRASKSLALQTDSSYRFERGVDPNLPKRAAWRAAHLIAELTGGSVVDGCTDAHPVKTRPITANLRISRLNRLLGTDIKPNTASRILDRLEIKNEENSEGILSCTIPTFRPDLTREVDLIEEVGRIYDYNRIPRPESAPFLTPSPLTGWEIFHNQVQTVAARLRYKEISTNSLLSKNEADLFSNEEEQIHTLNPVSQEATTLRTTLLGGFLKSLQYNLNRNAKTLRFFEVGNVYRNSKEGTWIDGIEEHSRLLMGVCGFRKIENWQSGDEPFTIFDLKSDLEAFFAQIGVTDLLERTSDDPEKLVYKIHETPVANLKQVPAELANPYEIDLPAFTAEIDLTLLYNLDVISTEKTFKPVSKYPPFAFDASFIVDEKRTAGELSDIIQQTTGEILDSVDVFDVYTGENLGKGKKSIAFRLTFLD